MSGRDVRRAVAEPISSRHPRVGRLALLALLAATAACPGRRSGEEVLGADTPAAARLLPLYQRDDFFRLRAILDTLSVPATPTILLLRAATAQAFNEPARSNRDLTELERQPGPLASGLRVEAARLRFRNDLRLYDYAAAVRDARALLALADADSVVRADVDNDARIAGVLADVPPQRVLQRAATELRLSPDGRAPVQIGDSTRAYLLDTGANFSVLSHSEVRALGLAVRPAGVQVGTSTGSRVRADVTVAPRVRVGGIELSDVVFLVLPDEALSFGPSLRIAGLIGFPVVAALGEVEFRRDGIVRIPAEVPVRPDPNLALRNLTPLVSVTLMGEPAICELDTGAGETVILQPFFERFRERIERAGQPETVRTAGAGGARTIGAFALRDVPLVVGGVTVTRPQLRAYTQSVAVDPTQSSDCRLGQDVLRSFPGYTLNLRSMNLLPS